MKRRQRRLALRTTTIRDLTATGLGKANGGSIGTSHFDPEEVGASRHCVIGPRPIRTLP